MKTAIITGASHGLGLELANTFAASDEWRVTGTGRSERPSELAESASYEQFDASDASACLAFWQKLAGGEPGEVTLINNAGGFIGGDLKSADASDYAKMMATNYFTSVNMTSALVKTLAKARLFNIISSAALAPSPHASSYGASKAATRQFFESLQKELDGNVYKITNLYPNMIATSGPAKGAIEPRDLTGFIFWQADNPGSFYVKDVTLIGTSDGKDS